MGKLLEAELCKSPGLFLLLCGGRVSDLEVKPEDRDRVVRLINEAEAMAAFIERLVDCRAPEHDVGIDAQGRTMCLQCEAAKLYARIQGDGRNED